MANIDKRIVEMKFDNNAFERGVAATLSTLGRLKDGLGKLDGAAKGLSGINVATKGVNLGPLNEGVSSLTTRFGALQIAGVTALSNIANKAVNAGTQLVKSLTIAPISQGFGEYELKMKSIQTILANTARHGTTLATVNDELNKLNEYADKTIYNFAEMTKNASLFTASGMKIEEATTVIKGFSNAAAASGTGATEAARAAYQLSQALNKGKITMEDWRSLSNAGMGNKNMTESLVEIAQAMGGFEGKAVTAKEASANFTGSLEKGWLSADIMSTYLKAMSGDMTDAELAAKGLSAAQITALQAQAEIGLDAATKVRTLSGLMSTLKESVASGWASSFEIIFGNFDEATKLFSSVSDTIGGMFTASGNARNKFLADWKLMGGRNELIESISNSFKALMAVLKPVREAFRTVFPAMTGNQLADLTDKLRWFTRGLMVGKDTAANIKSTFEGLFSVLKLGKMILSGLVQGLFSLFGTAGEGVPAIFSVTAGIGELVTAFVRLVEYSGIIKAFWAVVFSPLLIIKPLIGLISDLAVAISALFRGDTAGFAEAFGDAFKRFGGSFGPIADKLRGFTDALSNTFKSAATLFETFGNRVSASGNSMVAGIFNGLQSVATFLSSFFTDARGAVDGLTDSFSKGAESGKGFFSGFDAGPLNGFKHIVSTVNDKLTEFREKLDFGPALNKMDSGASSAASGGMTALSGVATVAIAVWDFLGKMLSGIGSVFGPVITELSAFFTTVVAKVRGWIEKMDMRDAILALNAGILIYFVKTLGGFFKSGQDMFDNIGQAFGGLTDTLKSMQNAVRASIIMQIAIAVGVLVAALFVLARIDAKALTIAIAAVGVLFTQIYFMIKKLDDLDPQSMIRAGLGMIAFATAILVLSAAVKVLGEMDPDVLVQGGIAIGVMMAALAGMVLVLNKLVGIPAAAAGLLILSVALLALSFSLKLYADIPWTVIEQGLSKMAITLAALGFAMQFMPKDMMSKAAGLAILSLAMIGLAKALQMISDIEGAGKALLILALGLGAMVLAMNAATGAIVGAAAIAIVAASLVIMVEAVDKFITVMERLAEVPMDTIVQAMKAFATIAIGISLASVLLIPAVPVLAALAAVALVAGVALLALGTGMTLFAGGLALLGTVGTAGIMTFLAALPLMVYQAGLAFEAIIDVVKGLAGKIMEAAGALIVAFVKEIGKRAVEIYAAGLDMLIGFLKAIYERIGLITTLAIGIVLAFIEAINGRLDAIIQKGVDFILSFVEGLAKAIRGEKERTGEAGSDLAMAIVEGMISGLKAFIKLLPPKVEALANAAIVAFKKFLGINSPSTVFSGFGGDIVMGLIEGIGKFFGRLGTKVVELARSAITAIRKSLPDWANAGIDFVVNIISGVGRTIGRLGTAVGDGIRAAIRAAKKIDASEIGGAIVDGIATGIRNSARRVKDAAVALAEKLPGWAKKVLGINSPSKEFIKIGEFVNDGLVKGLTNSSKVEETMKKTSDLLTTAMTAAKDDAVKAEATLKKLTDARNRDTFALKEAHKALLSEKGDRTQELERIRVLEQRIKDNALANKTATAALAQAKAEVLSTTAARDLMAKGFAKEKAELKSLATNYDTLTESLDKANEQLDAAMKTRDDYKNSIKDQYDNGPDITSETTLTDYIDTLEKKIADTNAFSVAVQKLKDLGLDDALYKELITKGIDALPFVEELLSGGAQAVMEVNKLGVALGKEATSLGHKASRELYQAGVQTADGLVRGIASKRSAVVNQMEQIAYAMLAAIQKTLKIKSPSKEFEMIGKYSTQGLANGLKNYSSMVEKAASGVGGDALIALRNSLSGISDAVLDGVDTSPVIRPIIDLTDIEKNAGRIGSILSDQALSVDSAYSNASAVSSSYRRNQQTTTEAVASAAEVNVNYTQNNYSPKAISQVEVYRQTNNLLSTKKGALIP